MSSPSQILSELQSHDAKRQLSALRALKDEYPRLSRGKPLTIPSRDAVHRIIKLLNGKNGGVCQEALRLLDNFATYENIRIIILKTNLVQKAVALLDNSDIHICGGAARVLTTLTDFHNGQTAILDNIAVSKLIDLLDDSRPDVIRGAIKVLTQLLQHEETTTVTRNVIVALALPMIVHLLDHRWRSISEGAFAVLTQLADHDDTRADIVAQAVPRIVTLLDSWNWVGEGAFAILTQLAHYEDTRAVIGAKALPRIIALLDQSWCWIREGAFAVLTQLAHHKDTRAVIVAQALPKIGTLLDYSWRWISEGAFAALKQLAHYEDTRGIIVAQILPKIVIRLDHPCRWIGEGAFGVLAQLALNENTRAVIVAQVLPMIITLLDHSNHDVCEGACRVLTQLTRHEDTRATIVAQALPKIVALLYHSSHSVRGGAIHVLTQMARHEETRASIFTQVVPHLVPLFDHSNPHVCAVYQTYTTQKGNKSAVPAENGTYPSAQSAQNNAGAFDDNGQSYGCPGDPGPDRESQPERARDQALRAVQLNSQAVAAFQSERYDDAIVLFTEAISLDPTIASFYTNRGTAYAKMERYLGALGDFQLATSFKTYKATAKVLTHTARCRLFLGSPPSALLALREALLLEAENINALALKSRVIEILGHISGYEGARSRKHWRMAGKSYEACLTAYAQEGDCIPIQAQGWGVELLIGQCAWPEAVLVTDTILRNEPKAIEVMVLRAIALFLAAKISDAIAQLNAVLKMDPDNHRASTLRSRIIDIERLKKAGNSLFGAGQWDVAIVNWSEALEKFAENEDIEGSLVRAILLFNRATALTKLGLFPEGLKDVNQSLEINPRYFKARRARGRIYIGLELFKSAIRDFKAALECDVSSVDPIDVRALRVELEDTELLAEKEANKVTDYYEILGLPRTCTSAQIRKAYHMKALQHHPDKGGIPEMFKLVSEANETLSDSESRRLYDARLSASDT